MKIHHATFPTTNPQHVARVHGELLGADAMPMPHPSGAWMVVDRDDSTTLLELWPVGHRVAEAGPPDGVDSALFEGVGAIDAV